MSPTNSQPTRQRKTGLPTRLAWIPAVLLVGFVSLACSATDLGVKPVSTKNASACADRFMTAVVHNQAAGLYDCLSFHAKVDYFDKFGWQSDKDIQSWLNAKYNSQSSGLSMKTFGQNPVHECQNTDNNNNCTVWGNGYHYYIAANTDSGPAWDVGVGIEVVLNDAGKIIATR